VLGEHRSRQWPTAKSLTTLKSAGIYAPLGVRFVPARISVRSAEVRAGSQSTWVAVEVEVEFCAARGCSCERPLPRRDKRIERRVVNYERTVGGVIGGGVGQVSLAEGGGGVDCRWGSQ